MNEVAVRPARAAMVELPPLEFSEEERALIKDACSAQRLTDSEFKLFLYVCAEKRLNPLNREIYAVKRKDRELGREVMTIQTGIDGLRKRAEETGCYAPGREPTYVEENGRLLSATSYVNKWHPQSGTWHEVAATAFFAEYAQEKSGGGLTRFWARMPHGQLAKCAEALALRKAFPTQLANLYTFDEMAQADNSTRPVDARLDREFPVPVAIGESDEADQAESQFDVGSLAPPGPSPQRAPRGNVEVELTPVSEVAPPLAEALSALQRVMPSSRTGVALDQPPQGATQGEGEDNPPRSLPPSECITASQRTKLFATLRDGRSKEQQAELIAALRRFCEQNYGTDSTAEIPAKHFTAILRAVESGEIATRDDIDLGMEPVFE